MSVDPGNASGARTPSSTQGRDHRRLSPRRRARPRPTYPLRHPRRPTGREAGSPSNRQWASTDIPSSSKKHQLIYRLTLIRLGPHSRRNRPGHSSARRGRSSSGQSSASWTSNIARSCGVRPEAIESISGQRRRVCAVQATLEAARCLSCSSVTASGRLRGDDDARGLATTRPAAARVAWLTSRWPSARGGPEPPVRPGSGASVAGSAAIAEQQADDKGGADAEDSGRTSRRIARRRDDSTGGSATRSRTVQRIGTHGS